MTAAAQVTSDQTSPAKETLLVEGSTSPLDNSASLAASKAEDPFNRLEFNLRTAFSTFSEKPSVWKHGYRLDRSPEVPGSRRGSREESVERTRLFRVLLVDKVCCFRPPYVKRMLIGE